MDTNAAPNARDNDGPMKRSNVSPLYSMRRLERMTGVDRRRLAGLVEGMGLRTYSGAGHATVIDQDGLKLLLAKLGMTADQLQPIA